MKHTAVSVVNKLEDSFPLENFFMPSDHTHSILWKICTVLFGGKLAPLFSPKCKALQVHNFKIVSPFYKLKRIPLSM